MLTNYSGQGLFPFDIYENKLSLYILLGLKDPIEFREPNITQNILEGVNNHWRITGRTTNTAVEALFQTLQGNRTHIVFGNCDIMARCRKTIVKWRTQLNHSKPIITLTPGATLAGSNGIDIIIYEHLAVESNDKKQLYPLKHIPNPPGTHWSYLRMQRVQENGKWDYCYE